MRLYSSLYIFQSNSFYDLEKMTTWCVATNVENMLNRFQYNVELFYATVVFDVYVSFKFMTFHKMINLYIAGIEI